MCICAGGGGSCAYVLEGLIHVHMCWRGGFMCVCAGGVDSCAYVLEGWIHVRMCMFPSMHYTHTHTSCP